MRRSRPWDSRPHRAARTNVHRPAGRGGAFGAGLLLTACLLLGPLQASADEAATGEATMALAARSGCFICHGIEPDASVPVPLGPAYTEIARHYRGREDAQSYLEQRIVEGSVDGPQNWADQVNMSFMPPNVYLSMEDASQLARWILSMGDPTSPNARLLTFESMLNLSSASGCLACHRLEPDGKDPTPLAPSFREIAARYGDQPGATQQLLDSVRNGTLNQDKSWPRANMRFMPASVALSERNAQDLVAWILSLEASAE